MAPFETSQPDDSAAALAALAEAVGAGAVLTGQAAEPFATDVYRRLETPLAVVRPATIDALRQAVVAATSRGLAVFVRGGGASYTDAYLPTTARSILIDMEGLNRVLEINEADGYVTVEAGASWAALKAALDGRGLRTPFWGPFSGLVATVGGSVSQNALSHGSGGYGISAQSVLSMQVVTTDGELLATGSAARGAAPFARFYGPDLAGLFTGDCGALGVKATVTLPLLRRKAAFRTASFAFTTFEAMHDAMRATSMEGLDESHFALDAALSQGQIARQDGQAVMGVGLAVLRSSPSLIKGLAQLARMAAAGKRSLRTSAYMTHFIVEGADDAEVKAKLHRLRRVLGAFGREIANSVPSVVRGTPFAPLFNTLGPGGERWVPVHGVLAQSKAVAFHHALTAFYAERAADMRRLGVWTGGMFSSVGPSGFLYEIAIYWPDAISAYHRRAIPADYLAGLKTHPENLESRAYVHRLKGDLIALYARFEAIHFQIGKAYPYARGLSAPTLGLIRSVKAALDPAGLMNPGALGLARERLRAPERGAPV